jgi:hypothetical protein
MMDILGPTIDIPDWIDRASCDYSRIEGRRDSVRVKPPADVDASDENPGTLCLQLVADSREAHVRDAAGNEEGVIWARRPGFGYTMQRGGVPVWTVSPPLSRHAHEEVLDPLGRTGERSDRPPMRARVHASPLVAAIVHISTRGDR